MRRFSRHALIRFLQAGMVIFGIGEILIVTGCGRARRDWHAARKRDTIIAYDLFLSRHGHSLYADSAFARMKRLYYIQARQMDLIPAYEAFLKRYPRGALADSAQRRIEWLRFEAVRRRHALPAYRRFLASYPNSPLVSDVQAAIEGFYAGRNPLFRTVNRVHLFDHAVYEGPYGPIREGILPFRDTAERILQAVGVETVSQTDRSADAFVTIQCRGVVVVHDSIAADSVWDGAEIRIEGAISVQKRGDRPIERPFRVRTRRYGTSALFLDPQVLLNEAFCAPGSFPEVFSALIADLFGPAGLVHLLGEDDPLAPALQTVLMARAERALPDLLHGLRYGAPLLRRRCTVILARSNLTLSDSLLLPLVDDPDPEVRVAGIEALGKRGGPQAIDRLRRLIGDPDPRIRRASAAALVHAGDPEASRVLDRLLDDPDPSVVAVSAAGLGFLQDTTAVGRLIALLGHESDAVQDAARSALLHIGQPAIPYWIASFPNVGHRVRFAILDLVGRFTPPEAIPLLVRALGGRNAALAFRAREILPTLGGGALEALLEAVEADSTRGHALVALGGIDDPRAFSALIHFLESGDREAVRHAAEGLARLRRAEAVPALIRVFEKTTDMAVRTQILQSLATIGDPTTFRFFERLLDSDDMVLRQWALEGLAGLRSDIGRRRIRNGLRRLHGDLLSKAIDLLCVDPDTEILRVLVPYLAHESPRIRRRVERAFRSHPRMAAGLLIQALDWGDRDLKRQASLILGKIHAKEAIPHLIRNLSEQDRYLLDATLDGLRMMGKPAIEPLVSALTASDGRIRRRAAEALAGIPLPRLAEPFRRLLEGKDPEAAASAARGLGLLGDRAAVPLLIRALDSEAVFLRKEAAVALGRIGDPVAISALQALLADEAVAVRVAAAEALARLPSSQSAWALVGQMADPDPTVQNAVAEALVAQGSWAVPFLVDRLSHGEMDERKTAARLLARIGPEAVPSLIPILEKGDLLSRWMAVKAVAPLGDLRLAPVLAGLLGEKNPEFFADVREAFLRIGPEAIPILVDRLSDRDPWVRWAGYEILGFMKTESTARFFLEGLEDPSWEVRHAAAKALRKLSEQDHGTNRKAWARWVRTMEKGRHGKKP